MEKAGIPKFYWDLKAKDLPGTTPSAKIVKNQVVSIAETLKKGGYPPHPIVVTGPTASVKIVGYTILRAALLRFCGCYESLDVLTDKFLQKEKEEFNRVRNSQVLAMFFGDEYTQNVHRYLLKHLSEYRADGRFFTIWLTAINQNGISPIYNHEFAWLKSAVWLKLTEELQI